MRTTTVRQSLKLISCLAILLACAPLVQAQMEQEAMGVCFRESSNRAVAVVRGFIGGEAHDSWVLHLTAGRKLTVHITSAGNRAGFTVATSEFGEAVTFGKESNGGRTWTGTVPQTGVYYISVVAHPSARYTLRVTKQ